MRDLVTGVWAILSTAWRLDRRKTALSAVLIVAGALAGPLLAAALAWMTSAMVGGHPATAALAGALVAGLAVMTLTFSHFAFWSYLDVSDLAELDFDKRLLALSNGSPGIEHHEQADQADALTVLRQESRQFRGGLQAMLLGVGLILAMIFTAVLLARQSPLLLLLPLAAVPALVTGRMAERVLDRAKTAAAEPSRAALNLFHLATDARFAGELRVLGLRDELRRRHAGFWAAGTRSLWRAQLSAAWLRAAGQLVFAVTYLRAVLFVIAGAAAGRRGVGDVVLVVALAAQVNQQVITAVRLLQNLLRVVSVYRRLARYASAVRPAGTPAATAGGTGQRLPGRLRTGIELHGVSFTYPGTQAPALSDVGLLLPAGATVALVGENGAGKTTLVKLLCGFYQPSAGRVTVDGTDLRELRIDAWRERIAAGFQDFGRYEFLAQQTVGVGDLPAISSEAAVLAGLDRAHAAGLVGQLPAGLSTQLGKSYADGAELSGGQWQKLALGRAMMRGLPLLLVLDEPTSALDAEAEHALFERYAEQAGRVARTTGAITVLVSHRFSTVRMADLIVVVRDGRIVEAGSHGDLIRDAGLYADLFSLQARAYR